MSDSWTERRREHLKLFAARYPMADGWSVDDPELRLEENSYARVVENGDGTYSIATYSSTAAMEDGAAHDLVTGYVTEAMVDLHHGFVYVPIITVRMGEPQSDLALQRAVSS